MFDKPDPLEGPYFEETIYVTPSRFPESVHHAIENAPEMQFGLWVLSHGPVHAEFRITMRRMATGSWRPADRWSLRPLTPIFV